MLTTQVKDAPFSRAMNLCDPLATWLQFHLSAISGDSGGESVELPLFLLLPDIYGALVLQLVSVI